MTRATPTTQTPVADVMKSGLRARKSHATLSHIGATAWAMFEAYGFDAVSMESIALAADVAKGTLYKYFPLKESLIGHKFDSDRREQAKKINETVIARKTCAERLSLRFQIEAQYIEKMRRYVTPYLRYKLAEQSSSLPSATPGAGEIFIAELLAVGQATGEITSTIAAAHLAEYLRLLRLAVLVRWLQTPGASLNAMNEEMLRLFLRGAQPQTQAPP